MQRILKPLQLFKRLKPLINAYVTSKVPVSMLPEMTQQKCKLKLCQARHRSRVNFTSSVCHSRKLIKVPSNLVRVLSQIHRLQSMTKGTARDHLSTSLSRRAEMRLHLSRYDSGTQVEKFRNLSLWEEIQSSHQIKWSHQIDQASSRTPTRLRSKQMFPLSSRTRQQRSRMLLREPRSYKSSCPNR